MIPIPNILGKQKVFWAFFSGFVYWNLMIFWILITFLTPSWENSQVFPILGNGRLFAFFFKCCFWWWSGGQAVFLHLGKSSGNIIGQFPQCTNFLPQETTFWYHTLLRGLLGIYLDFNLTSYISGVFAQMTISKVLIEGHFRQWLRIFISFVWYVVSTRSLGSQKILVEGSFALFDYLRSKI